MEMAHRDPRTLLFNDDYDYKPDDSPDEDSDYILEDDFEEDEFEPEDPVASSSTTGTTSAAGSQAKQYIGRDSTIWLTRPIVKPGRSLRFKQQIYVPNPRHTAKGAATPIDNWKALIDTSIIKIILHHTNEEIQKRTKDREEEGVQQQSYHHETTMNEIYAIFGLLYLMGVQKNSRVNISDIWSTDNGVNVYRATMPEKRFRYLLTIIRFDDRVTRSQRQYEDNLAPIREVWDKFIRNCTENYCPAHNLTIDEQLMDFRGHCRFRNYMKPKPAKYGMRVVMLNDATTSYMYNAVPAVGKSQKQLDEEKARKEEEKKQKDKEKKTKKAVKTIRPKITAKKQEEMKAKIEKKRLENLQKDYVASQFVRRLAEPIRGTKRNITVDNWFTSVPLFNEMLEDYQLSMVGTARKALPQAPQFFVQKHKPNTSLFAFDETKTLVSYTSATKNPKVVLLLSTLSSWYKAEVDKKTSKPALILFYNNTKGGTDTFDHLCANYTTARKSNRWTMRFMYGILDMAGINAMVLYSLNQNQIKGEEQQPLLRRKFLWCLGQSLIQDFLRERYETKLPGSKIRIAIESILRLKPNDLLSTAPSREPTSDSEHPSSHVRRDKCHLCIEENNIRCHFVGYCNECLLPYCREHQGKRCFSCT